MKDKEHTSESLRTYIASGRDSDGIITSRSTQAGYRDKRTRGWNLTEVLVHMGTERENRAKGIQLEDKVVKEK
jgi:hypothetical protein